VQARWLRWLLPPSGLLLGITAHALNNGLGLLTVGITGQAAAPVSAEEAAAGLNALSFPQAWLGFSLMQLVIFLPFLVIVWVALYHSGRWERRTIREELATEGLPVVTPEELEAINRDQAFRTRRVARGDGGRSAAIVCAQHELAFRKRRVRTEGGDPNADLLVASWRAEIARLPG
jgi:protease PrsW